MQPDKVSGSGLDEAEAVEDGTALIGVDPEKTDRVGDTPGANRRHAEAVGADWNRISSRIAELFASGVSENDPRTQDIINDHYHWLCNFWTPDRDSYLRLAGMYVNQPKFRKRIERKKPKGMAGYMRDAMTAYAWVHLH